MRNTKAKARAKTAARRDVWTLPLAALLLISLLALVG